MLSVAAVRSASGAATYFAKDNYYTVEGASEFTVWGGEGASVLGLSGDVSKAAFEGILNGILPDGEAVAQVANRRAGLDLTFSMPKSASIMALVAGDLRLLGANMTAVKYTMAWVEANLAQGRRDVEGRKVPIPTGNLVYALFQHDTSRALDPQAHIHAVIANLTRMPDGRWQALHADKIWSHNSVIGSIYHAYLRSEIERLGYSVELKGKHGTFEISGVPAEVHEAFSKRREAILEKAAEIGIVSHRGRDRIAINTRDPKLNVEDRAALKKGWNDRVVSLGFDGRGLIVSALARSQPPCGGSVTGRSYRAVVQAVELARYSLGELLRPGDPLVDHAILRAVSSPAEASTQLAVASAVRILSEREAAWPARALMKTALDLGLKDVTAASIEKRIIELEQRRQLIPGVATFLDGPGRLLTTRNALGAEQQILDMVERGTGRSLPLLAASEAPRLLQAAAALPLNSGQLAAATLILSSSDRTVVVQGVAGAGKSTMLQAVASIASDRDRKIVGLAMQNKMVADLQEGSGIGTQTIASFIFANERFIDDRVSRAYGMAREKLAGAIMVVDETSMVSTDDMLKLHRITDALDIDKLVLVGDRQQLSSIGAGKAFALIQAGGGPTAFMEENIRQRTDQLRTVAALANVGHASTALQVLGDKVVENTRPAMAAADLWLALSKEDRQATVILASGRASRAEINQRIQEGLVAQGTLGGQAVDLTVFERVNTAREEMRYAATYRPGQILEVGRSGAMEIGLKEGRYDVLFTSPGGKVEIKDGRRRIRFDPQRLSPTDRRDRLQLLEKQTLQLWEGDRIRWTANDRERGLHNSAIARVISLDGGSVTVELADRSLLTLSSGDAMLSRMDLAYSLNMHMAQGITTDKAIAVMSSHERYLSNQRLFNVAVTRVRDELTMVVDEKAKLERQLDSNAGNKTSALEVVGRLAVEGNTPQGHQIPSRDAGDSLGLPGARTFPERSLGLDL